MVEALEAQCGICTKASCAWMQIGVAKGDDGWASTWIVQRIGVIRLTSKRGREDLASVLQQSGERRSVSFWCFAQHTLRDVWWPHNAIWALAV